MNLIFVSALINGKGIKTGNVPCFMSYPGMKSINDSSLHNAQGANIDFVPSIVYRVGAR